jgi:putative colanic acid biosynthesis UDP-glucose lipid carrier transferase
MVAWPLSLALVRILVRKLVRAFRIRGLNEKKAVIAGRSRAGMNFARHIQDNPWTGTRVLGFFYDLKGLEDVKTNGPSRPFPYLGNIDALIQWARQGDIDIIYLAIDTHDEKATRKLIKAVDGLPTAVHYVPEVIFLDLVIGGDIILFDQRPVIALRNTAINGVGGAVKRLMDIVLSLTVLVILLPLFLVIAAAIKLDSKGPVFFIQPRYGIDGEKILVYKFRSMYDGCDKPGAAYAQACKNDARITKLGAFLRKTSLDELPQLINVLQGRMSLVGPRPHPVAMNDYYQKIITGYMIRQKVKPGITGLAQVMGYRGETDTLEKMEKRINHDLRYIREWSLLFDLEILIRTLFVFLFQKNAY